MPSTRKQVVVSFSRMVGVYKTLHIKDYTADEISSCWYNKYEKRLIKLDIRNTVMLMNVNNNKNNKNNKNKNKNNKTNKNNCYIPITTNNILICTRGLEGIGCVERVNKRNQSIDAVIEEQQKTLLQFDDNNANANNIIMYNPKKIAAIYMQHTKDAKEMAKIMALIDQEFVIMNNKKKNNSHNDDILLFSSSLRTTTMMIKQQSPTTSNNCGGCVVSRSTTEGIGRCHRRRRSVSSSAA